MLQYTYFRGNLSKIRENVLPSIKIIKMELQRPEWGKKTVSRHRRETGWDTGFEICDG